MRRSIMLASIMIFLNRTAEMERLDRLATREGGGLVVVYGRRRIGKTRLLLEWSRRHGGLYTVGDQSSAEIQRRYFAQAVGDRLPGFGDVEYPDWRALLTRLARDAVAASWRGPLVIDELPYLATASPELPSLLQRWIDHEAETARLVVALAGSSQRMMQGLVLGGNAPLYGRAREILDLGPLDPAFLREAFAVSSGRELVELYTAWGGVPRYWELASEIPGGILVQIERLVLDPLSPLHNEPDRVLLEEIPSALDLRPLLDAIGAGAHRVSEVAGRLGRPATSMARPLDRLVGMGLVRREVPFGETEKESRRSLYKIADPFFRLWFRVVAPHRGPLASGSRETRLAWLARFWDILAAEAWEELCRSRVPQLPEDGPLGELGPWKPAARWWKGNEPEWDLVSESLDGRRLLLGEVKWSAKPWSARALAQARAALAHRPRPSLPTTFDRHEEVRVLFVPDLEGRGADGREPRVVTAEDLLPSREV
jgi:AAA+ ATPase superfamily predicted ATPase